MLIEILFWIFILFIVHTYIFYPVLLMVLAGRKKNNQIQYEKNEDFPGVSIILAVYNEELVLEEKLNTIFASEYPVDKIEVLCGSDNSNDRTNDILSVYAKKYNGLRNFFFSTRQGKANIVNALVNEARNDVLVLTDANVFFTSDTLFQMVKHFKNESIKIVGANIVNTNIKDSGISYQERTYLINENKIKYYEGVIWGTMIGAFGGCYAIKKQAYRPVPENYFMDDFYITMHVLADGGKALNELQATCYEDVSNLIQEEFRRKVRISIGNFQNLKSFRYLLKKPFTGLAFSFFSHKVLRWFTPFFIIIIQPLLIYLALTSVFYGVLFLINLALLIMPFIDFLLRKINLHIVILRFISHFYSMNLALLTGYIKYKKGVKSNVWQPTKRNQ